jgi:predicted nuclease with TOPRIM domain
MIRAIDFKTKEEYWEALEEYERNYDMAYGMALSEFGTNRKDQTMTEDTNGILIKLENFEARLNGRFDELITKLDRMETKLAEIKTDLELLHEELWNEKRARHELGKIVETLAPMRKKA